MFAFKLVNAFRGMSPLHNDGEACVCRTPTQHYKRVVTLIYWTKWIKAYLKLRTLWTGTLLNKIERRKHSSKLLASNPGSPFRILSRSFGEKSEEEPGRISHVIRWHRDVNLPGVKVTTSLEKPSELGNKDRVCLRGIRIRRFGQHRRPYD